MADNTYTAEYWYRWDTATTATTSRPIAYYNITGSAEPMWRNQQVESQRVYHDWVRKMFNDPFEEDIPDYMKVDEGL